MLAFILLLCIGIALATSHEAHAEVRTSLDGAILDDFNDGDFGDGSPTTWDTTHFRFLRNYDASSGDFVIDLGEGHTDPTHALAYAELANHLISDFSIRTQVRMLALRIPRGGTKEDLNPAVTIAGRVCWPHLPNICGNESTEDYIYIDVRTNGDVVTARNADNDHPSGWKVAATDIRPLEEDFVMQVDAFGEDLRFWVWPAGEPRPAEPLIQYTAEDEPRIDPGGLEFGTVYSKAVYRYVHVSDTPIEDLAGDLNFDFHVDATDIDLLSAEVGSPEPRPWFDLNGDNEVNEGDRVMWVESLADTFFGDADLNGKVEFSDFLALSDNFNQPGGWAQGNFDGLDGVQFADFLLISNNFGNQREASFAQSVPEPDTSIIALVCCLCLLRRRKRIARVS